MLLSTYQPYNSSTALYYIPDVIQCYCAASIQRVVQFLCLKDYSENRPIGS